MSAQVKLVPSRTLEGKQVFILMVGAKMVGSYSTVAEAKAFLRKKFGSRFHEGTASVNPRKPATTKQVWIIQQKWPGIHGWEDVNAEDTWKDARRSIKEYRENQPEVPVRVILRRVKINPIKKRKPAKRRNIAMGITRGTGKTRRFFPIRASADYDPTRLGGSEGKRARSEKRSAAKKRSGLKAKGKKAIKSKSTVKTKLATKRRKAKKAVGLFGARALKKALPTSRRNPKTKRFLFFESKTGGYGADRNVFTAYAGTLQLAKKQFAKAFPSIYVKGNWRVEETPFISSKRSNPKSSRGKRSIPAAFKAQAQRAKAMTPAQRAAWAKKMQAARKAKARLKNR